MKQLLGFLWALTLGGSLLANGGPIDGSAYYSSGAIRLQENSQIQLKEEKLKVTISGDASVVEVNYRLINSGGAQSVTYAFPIDQAPEMCEDCGPQTVYFSDYGIWVSDKKLAADKQAETEAMLKTVKEEGHSYDLKIMRTWMVSELDFAAGEEIDLKVRYRVTNGFSDWETSKDFFPSFSQRTFIYDFSPAGYWAGDPRIEVTVDARKVLASGDEVSFSPQKFGFQQQAKGIYTWRGSDAALESLPPLEVSYSVEVAKLSELIREKSEIPNGMKARASSALQGNYSAANAVDGKLNTAWVEGKGGSGVGESLTLTFDSYPLGALLIYAGYTKSGEAYSRNNRIKRIRVEFIADPEKENMYVPEPEDIDLKDLPFVALGAENSSEMAQVLYSFGDMTVWITGLKITILEVYKGSKYEDTCLSELVFFPLRW